MGEKHMFRAEAPLTPFRAGTVVLVTLNTPREKFFGSLLEISPAGLSIRGIDLNSLDDFARMIRAEEPVTAGSVFFPMHRVERIEVDARNGDIPSLRERFEAKAGRSLSTVFDLADEEHA